MTGPPKLAVIGATGFIGSHLVRFGHMVGVDITPVPIPRVDNCSQDIGAAPGADRWRRDNGVAFDGLRRALEPFDVVINAAGQARAGSTGTATLWAANAVLPAVVAQAAQGAGVRRLVHISSAAVQGRLDPLDETGRHAPLSPYAVAKARAEQVLLDAESGLIPGEVVVYRPTSVQAVGHNATQAFARMVGYLPFVPLEGPGDRPVPVCLLANVVAGILFAAAMDDPAPIIVQPDEEMTVRRLVELFGARRVVALPPTTVNAALDRVARLTDRAPYLTSRVRWFELLLRGQATQAEVLPSAGFTAPVGYRGWESLAAAQRALVRPRAWRARR